ncbi:Pyridoxal 4-dehydrogenase [Planctomycetes bacterium Poly30]|uniref:Pyridoxal 4-dehydrogenase n=1 Tax=Saltatorellus ferox TaxID=2528018 RepID=A0A518ESV3_9BACT|nr:Pyridoxal 4-dehydrogenase [Planctomycetes bacterium Poly30]
MRPEAQDPDPTPAPQSGEGTPRTTGATSRVHRRPLGALGENVSAFGLGCGPLARLGDHADWKGTLDAAMGCGIDVVDMAPREFRAHSEEMLGRVMNDRRDDLFLSTRCTPLDGKPFDTSEKAVREQLEASLRRLRTDRIDLYQVHDVETANARRLLEITLPALVAARERGEVRYIGASGNSLDLLREILITFPVDAILSYSRFDLANADLAEAVLPAAEERGIAVINASPLHMGLLSNPEHAREVAAADRPAGAAAEHAFEIASRAGTDLPRLALEFAAQEPRIACTLVGCENAREVLANVQAFESTPTELERRAIEEIRAGFHAAEIA